MDSLPVASAADTETRRPASSNVDGMAEQMRYTNEQLLEAADILDAAHDVLLRDGWVGSLNWYAKNKQGRCIESAVCVAATGWLDVSGLFSLRNMAEHSPVIALLRSRGITHVWNDYYHRTEDEVFEKLRTVAKELREEAS